MCIGFQELSKQWKNKDLMNRSVENVVDDDDNDDNQLYLWKGLPTKGV